MTKSNKAIKSDNQQYFTRSKLMIFGLTIMLAAVGRVYAEGWLQSCDATDDGPKGSCSSANNLSCTITENPLGSCQWSYDSYCIAGNNGADRLNISHGSCTAHTDGYTCDIDPNQPITHSNGTANCASALGENW